MLSRRVATIVTLVIVAAFVVVSVAPAFAAAPAMLPTHARLTGSTPADGSSVDTARAVTLQFNEDVNPSFVEVEVAGPAGDETDGDATADGGTVSQPLMGDLAAGAHVVTYRVVSTDGHPVSGTVTFTTTAGPASTAPSPSAAASPTAAATAAATPAPAPTASTVVSPQGVTPTSEDSGSGVPWLVIAAVALLVALGLGALLRTRSGRAADSDADGRMDAEPPTRGDAGNLAEGAAGTDADPTPRTPAPPA